jgi:hypothetical protein
MIVYFNHFQVPVLEKVLSSIMKYRFISAALQCKPTVITGGHAVA